MAMTKAPPARPRRGAGGGRTIERFVPRPDVRERHSVRVRAPAGEVFAAAEAFDPMSLAPVRWIFAARARMLGAPPPRRWAHGLAGEMESIGWGVLSLRPGRERVMGAVTRPWEPEPVFTPLPPERFAAFVQPGRMKIAWTIEAERLGPSLTRLSTETRAVATDDASRRRFRGYWRRFGVGTVVIRWLLLRAIRRRAEQAARRHQPIGGTT
ncbi:MAG TPA: hypothetical protein VFJ82_15720 [Longimicrobium sp.]|nr:hypothetical protein [Longimicrobium sp.]